MTHFPVFTGVTEGSCALQQIAPQRLADGVLLAYGMQG